MNDQGPKETDRDQEIDELRSRLAEAEETLRAIRHGEIDALLVTDAAGDRLFTLRTADAPYRALVEQMREGAVTLSPDGDIVYSNRKFAEFTATPLEQVIGASIDRFLADDDDIAALKALIAVGAGTLRTRLRHDSGRPVDVQISVSGVVLEGVDHRTLIVTDISALTKVQRESRSKDEFLAMLAHELRNPLGAIGGAVQVLSLSKLRAPHAIRARDIIERQVVHMARLMDDLLDVGRVVTGKIALNPHSLDLAGSVRASVASMASARPAEGRVILDAESVWVNADPVRLEQIIGNLLSNALKFTPVDRGVRIVVKAEGDDALLAVTDEGVGIDAALLPHIFDLFVQGDDSRDRSKGGLGIGLTLVRRLVELHGGTVEASSRGHNQGSTFTVRLRAIPSVVHGVADAAQLKRSAKRVLLVDDNADSREMYGLVLKADGHEVFEAADGLAGVAAFRRYHPDIAVVDIGLPGVDGYEVARRVRSEPDGQDVRLIALTGYGFPEDRERSRAAGFDRHLVKPVAPEDLQRELGESFHLPSLY